MNGLRQRNRHRLRATWNIDGVDNKRQIREKGLSGQIYVNRLGAVRGQIKNPDFANGLVARILKIDDQGLDGGAPIVGNIELKGACIKVGTRKGTDCTQTVETAVLHGDFRERRLQAQGIGQEKSAPSDGVKVGQNTAEGQALLNIEPVDVQFSNLRFGGAGRLTWNR